MACSTPAWCTHGLTLTTSSFHRKVSPCEPFPKDVGPCTFSGGWRPLYFSKGFGSCTFFGDVGPFTFPRDVSPCAFSQGCRQCSHGTGLIFDRLKIRAFGCLYIKTPSRSKFHVNRAKILFKRCRVNVSSGQNFHRDKIRAVACQRNCI